MTALPETHPHPRRRRWWFWLASVAGLGVVAFLDFTTGWETSFSILYVIPVFFAAWKLSRRSGLVVSFISSAFWLIADVMTHPAYSHPAIPYWNAFVRMAAFSILVIQVALMRKTIDRESELARTDPLTGAANSRAFFEAARDEIARCRRYGRPLSLAYMDLDGFKAVNDRLGHLAGDALLVKIAHVLRARARQTDLVARLGGDEFALLLPETGAEAAEAAVAKLRAALREEMTSGPMRITFSIGIVTCSEAPATVDELLKRGDALAYEAKAAGRDRVRTAVCDFSHSPEGGMPPAAEPVAPRSG